MGDWEVLHSSDSGMADSGEVLRGFEGIEGDSEGMIRSDYFSIHALERYGKNVALSDADEETSVHSNTPSWIDPGSEHRYGMKYSGEFWSDSSSDRSDERRYADFEEKSDLGFVKDVKAEVGFEGIGEIGDGCGENFVSFADKNKLGFEGYGETHSPKKNSGLFWSDSDGDGSVSMKSDGEYGQLNENENVATEDIKSVVKSSSEEEKRRAVWWKVPLELLKFCAFRVSPVWSFTLAAAIMGLVILGRRLHKRKRKTRSLELKVIVDDKKVSQFMSRAARLNETFSVVRRVPMIRPALPAAGLTLWPVVSLR